MKKSLFVLLICTILSVFLLSSCNVDASDGLADQVRNSAQASGIRVLQLLSVSGSDEMVIRSDKGIYKITEGALTANYLSNDMKAAYCDGTYVYFLTQAGKLYKYTLTAPSDCAVVSDDNSYSYLDSNGFLLETKGTISKIGGDITDTDTVYEKILTSGNSYLGKVSGENKYYYNGEELDTSLTFKAFIATTGSTAFAATSDKEIYSCSSSTTTATGLTLTNSASGPTCLYTDGSGTYAVFKTSNSFDYLSSSSYDTVTSVTTNWASSIRSVEVSDMVSVGTDLYIATTNNGIWKVTSISDNAAEQIFY